MSSGLWLPEGTAIGEAGAMIFVKYTQGSGNPKSTQLILAFGPDTRKARDRGAKKGKSRRGVVHCLMCDEDLLTQPEQGILCTRELVAHVRLHDRRKAVQRLGAQLLARVKEKLSSDSTVPTSRPRDRSEVAAGDRRSVGQATA